MCAIDLTLSLILENIIDNPSESVFVLSFFTMKCMQPCMRTRHGVDRSASKLSISSNEIHAVVWMCVCSTIHEFKLFMCTTSKKTVYDGFLLALFHIWCVYLSIIEIFRLFNTKLSYIEDTYFYVLSAQLFYRCHFMHCILLLDARTVAVAMVVVKSISARMYEESDFCEEKSRQ